MVVHAALTFRTEFVKGARRPELHEVFSALSDLTRLHVVERLGRGACRASDLAESLGASRPGMSRHLRILIGAGVVREQADPEDGRARLLALDPGALDQMRHFVEQMSCDWERRLETFRDLAQQRAREKKSVSKKTRQAS